MGWSLTPEELEATKDKVAKINARAVKRGFTGRLDVVSEVKEVTRDVAGIRVVEITHMTSIVGEAPCYNGWTFQASLDVVGDNFIVRTAPGVESIDRTTLEPGKCDHCGINRYRKSSYVISDGTKQLQVGSSCIKDFLGWNASVVFFTEDDMEFALSGICGSGRRSYTIESVLAVSWACVTQFGYVRTSDMDCTRDKVATVFSPTTKLDRELSEAIKPIAQQAEPMAIKLREFILSDAFAGNSEYVQNLKVLCKSDVVTFEHLGFLASVPQAYARHLEKTFIQERAKSDSVSEWIGQPKEKLKLSVRIKAVKFIESKWGSSTLYTMLSDNGHVFKWFSTNGAFGDDETEQFFDIMGTVKTHEEYRGFKSTVLTRCKRI